MTGCPFKFGDVCLWASKLANNLPVIINNGDCYTCMRQQKDSQRRKGHKYRRTNTVTKLAAEKMSNTLGWDYEQLHKNLREHGTWKLCHMTTYLSSKKNKYFNLLTAVGFYESSLDDALTDWNYDELLSYLKQRKDDHSRLFPDGFYPSTKDLSSKQSFFKSFDKFLTSQGDRLGDVLHEVEYPTWVDTINDQQPNPQNKNCIITVCAGDRYLKMFEVIKDRYEGYAKKCNADLVILDGYTQGWWGLEKFRVRPFAETYERTCFLDSDIIIQKSAPNIFDLVPHNQIGMHDDWPLLISKSKNIGDFNFDKWRTYERNFLIKSQVLEEDFSYEQHHTLFNTGVVVCSKKHANIWTPMKKPFPRNHCDEQFWIEYLALKNNYEIYRLPLSMNIQHWMDCFDKMATLEMSHFLHVAIDVTKYTKEDVFNEVYTKYAD